MDELFLDFLVANSREKLTTPDPSAKKDEVLLVRLDPAERDEYAGWPAQPIDWQMILKGLRDAENAVIVIPEPLNWGKPSPDFIAALAESMVPLSSLVLRVEAQLTEDAAGPAFTGGLDEVIPHFVKASGDLQLASTFSALITAPDDQLRHGELGLLRSKRLHPAIPQTHRHDAEGVQAAASRLHPAMKGQKSGRPIWASAEVPKVVIR
nr:hypothetical protein [Prosthecobacter sp.]